MVNKGGGCDNLATILVNFLATFRGLFKGGFKLVCFVTSGMIVFQGMNIG